MNGPYREAEEHPKENRIPLSDALHFATKGEDTHNIIMMADSDMTINAIGLVIYLRLRYRDKETI